MQLRPACASTVIFAGLVGSEFHAGLEVHPQGFALPAVQAQLVPSGLLVLLMGSPWLVPLSCMARAWLGSGREGGGRLAELGLCLGRIRGNMQPVQVPR